MGCFASRSRNQQRVSKSMHRNNNVRGKQGIATINFKSSSPLINNSPHGLNTRQQQIKHDKKDFQPESLPLTQNVNHNQKGMTQFEVLYQRCCEYYKEHIIDDAYALVKQIYSRYPAELQSSKKDRQILQWIEQEYRDLTSIEDSLYRSPWLEKSNKNGVKVSIRVEKDNTVSTFIESELRVPYERFIAALIELDLSKKFVPFIAESTLEKKCARNARIGWAVNKFPFLTARETYFIATGYDRLQHDGTLFMFLMSLEPREDLQKKWDYTPRIDQNAVRIQYNFLAVIYTPISDKVGSVKMYSNIDMKLSFIPLFIMEMVSIKYGNDFFSELVLLAENYEGSEWQKKTNEDPSTVNFTKIGIKRYLSKTQKQ